MATSFRWVGVLAPSVLLLGFGTHALAFRISAHGGEERHDALLATGHRYFALAPVLAGALATVALVMILTRSVTTGGCARRRIRARSFVGAALLVAVLQEHLERLLASGDARAVVATAAERPFQLTLAFQVPAALLAYLVARILTRLADDAVVGLSAIYARCAAFVDALEAGRPKAGSRCCARRRPTRRAGRAPPALLGLG